MKGRMNKWTDEWKAGWINELIEWKERRLNKSINEWM